MQHILLLLLLTLWNVTAPIGAAQAALNPQVNIQGVESPASAPPTAPLLSPAATELSEQLQSLVTPQTSTTEPSSASDESAQDIVPNVGTRALDIVLAAIELVHVQAGNFIANLAAFPQLSAWLDGQRNDPKLIARWQSIGSDSLEAILPAILIAVLAEILLYPLRRQLRKRTPQDMAGKGSILLALFFIRAIPIITFVGLAVTLLDANETQKLPRFIILNVVYALALGRIVLALFRGMLAPQVSALRLLPVTNKQAGYGYKWLVVFSTLIIYSYFFFDVARALRVPDSAITVIANIFGLILVTLTTTVIIQARRFVAEILRGIVPPMPRDRTWFESLRVVFSRQWHILAIAYLVIGYLITALDVQNGFGVMLRGTVLTLVTLVVAQILLRLVRQAGRTTLPGTLSLHRDILRGLTALLIWGISFIAIAAAWGANIPMILNTPLGHRLSGAALSVFITTATLALIYEAISTAIDRHINRQTPDGLSYVASARARTLLPMLRNTVFFLFAVATGIVALSQAGVNIAPILAGAGVLGVAIGFGSQTLVKDFLTGLFIVLENTVAIGDVVKIGDHQGMVEAMSMRTLRLRHLETGNLHSIPFSEVTSIINLTKGFSYATIKIGVAYDTDLSLAIRTMREVGEALRQEPSYTSAILQPIEVQGVDALGDYAITLQARLCTQAGKQWEIRRVYLQRIKERFDALKIEIPFPVSVQIHKSTPPLLDN